MLRVRVMHTLRIMRIIHLHQKSTFSITSNGSNKQTSQIELFEPIRGLNWFEPWQTVQTNLGKLVCLLHTLEQYMAGPIQRSTGDLPSRGAPAVRPLPLQTYSQDGLTLVKRTK